MFMRRSHGSYVVFTVGHLNQQSALRKSVRGQSDRIAGVAVRSAAAAAVAAAHVCGASATPAGAADAGRGRATDPAAPADRPDAALPESADGLRGIADVERTVERITEPVRATWASDVTGRADRE